MDAHAQRSMQQYQRIATVHSKRSPDGA